MMIPSRYRDRLPAGLSYPVGAQALSDCLADLPHAEAMYLGFHRSPTLRASEFSTLLKSSDPLPVLDISVDAFDHLMIPVYPHIDPQVHSHVWEINVYPIPSPFRAAARVAILQSGIPIARRWLLVPRQPTWLSRRHTLTLWFDRARNSLAPEQTD